MASARSPEFVRVRFSAQKAAGYLVSSANIIRDFPEKIRPYLNANHGVEEWAAGFGQGWPKTRRKWLAVDFAGGFFIRARYFHAGHSKERVSRNRTITGEEGVPSRSNLLYSIEVAISPAIYEFGESARYALTMSTSVSTVSREEKPDEKLSSTSVESYIPHGNPHSEGSWLQRAKGELTFLLTTREGLIGDYDYVWLLTPDIPPFNRKYKDQKQPFYGIDDRMPLLLIVLLGLQHALAMIGGVVSPPLLIAGASGANMDEETISYLVSVALILSGIFTFFQILRLQIFNTGFWFGTGMITVVGEAFAVVPIAQAYFVNQYKAGHCITSTNGTKQPCPEAYGRILGTVAVVMLLQVAISFIKPRILMKYFPKLITGMVMVCIGSGLTANGIKSWAGGSGPCMSRPASGLFSMCPNTQAPKPHPWGSPVFVGLGFSVYATILLVELVGSPLVRNCSIAIGLTVGAVVAAATGYIDNSPIKNAPGSTVPWVKTFPLGFDGSLVLPLVACCITTSIGCLGDIVATAEVSGIAIDGEEENENLDSRVQGGLTADSVWSILSALATSTPMVCFAQNNGVIVLTGCASRRAGYACSFFLLLAGIASKFGAAIVALPPSVIGGMTTFLFTSIAVSGIRILSVVPWTRRNRFIATAALALGLGDLMVPNWAAFVMPVAGSAHVQALYDGIGLIFQTGYCIVAFVGCILNALLPEQKGSMGRSLPVVEKEEEEKTD